ncbi:MAG: hypothetical protein LBP53_01810 [Candidatus Peribacteria bacterium]|nr:hypothetical protein [Candidatus Peribacteria bacterium]
MKRQILPEFTEENILKFFGKESEVKTEAELKEFIKQQLFAQREQEGLIKAIETFVSTIRKDAMTVVIPKTMVEEEFKNRLHSLEQRFGSKEKVEEYLKSMTEDQAKSFVADIQNASRESLEKFFILNKITELLGIEIDWNAKGLSLEKKLYEYFNPSSQSSTLTTEIHRAEHKEKKSAKTSAKKTKPTE